MTAGLLVHGAPPAYGAGTQRLQGADRFGTAVVVSQSRFSAGVPVAYVANGGGFADALAGGAAASKKGGPVLLVAQDNVPSVTAEELARLQPKQIVILGGLAAVSTGVEQALGAYSSAVVRASGNDRFETAAAVSQSTFAPGVPVAFVANGAGFADALAGSASGGPVLLVTADSIPTSTADELRRLLPQSITMLGGSAVVSDGLAQQLRGFTAGNVGRDSGADRYATGVAVSANTFSTTPVSAAYLATGVGFADALAGGAVAGLARGPLLLLPGSCIPDNVGAELARLDPAVVYILGGTNVLAPGVDSLTPCPKAPVTFGDGHYRVGADIPAGTYRTRGGDSCYWERESGFGGTLEEIKANDLAIGGAVIVTIDPSDVGFKAERCGAWSNDLSPLKAPGSPFGEGMWQVPSEVAAGQWQNDGAHAGCYWERESSFSGELEAIIANDNTDDQTIVTLDGSERGFKSERCGTWTRIGS